MSQKIHLHIYCRHCSINITVEAAPVTNKSCKEVLDGVFLLASTTLCFHPAWLTETTSNVICVDNIFPHSII